MDLPTCPACGQSVLDDDVDECPFCGALMSGAPVAANPSATSTAAASRETTATDKTSSTVSTVPVKRPPSRTEPEPTPASDDPFELERTSASKKKVVHLRTLPEPGRRHEVTCPMCETVGYTARKAAGMDVRCANPDCQLPLFVAPRLSENAEKENDAAGGNRNGRSRRNRF